MEREAGWHGAGGSVAIKPPVAERRPFSHTHHGVTRTDDYAWLRAENWQTVMHDPAALAPDIRAYLEAENAYAANEMADVEGLRLSLFKEMRGRIKEDDSSVPVPDGEFAYGTRYDHGAEHPTVVRTPRKGGLQRGILDSSRMAAGKAYFRLGGFAHSPDHRLMAYAVDEKGNEYFTLRLREVETGLDLPDTIEGTSGAAIWANDGKTLFYVWIDANHRPAKIFRHAVGTDPSQDVVVYEEADAGFFIAIGKTLSRRFIVIDAHDHETSEIRVIDADAPDSQPRVIAKRLVGQEYTVGHGVDAAGDRLFILTNAGGAEDFKIVTAPTATPDRGSWRDLVPHVPGRLILDFTVYRDYLVRLERESSLPRIATSAAARNTPSRSRRKHSRSG